MGQQPKVVIAEAQKPRSVLQPGPARSWRSDKPGVPRTPEEVPRVGPFGHNGPDQGWAYKLIARTELPEDDPRLRDVLAALMMARASALGRAPVPEDLEVALVLCGYSEAVTPQAEERREHWLEAAAHESRPGETAVAEVDVELIVNGPDQVRYALQHKAHSG